MATSSRWKTSKRKSESDAGHRLSSPRAARYLSRMPRERAIQVRDALREVAGLAAIKDHTNIKSMSGGMAGWFRLRVGSYRVILQVTVIEIEEVLYVDAIGPRGDIYTA